MIIQGCSGVQLNVNVVEKGKLVQLAGSSVTIVIKNGTRKVTKPSTISSNGVVSTILTSDDLLTSGKYFVQAIVSYTDGRLFKSEQGTFMVESAL